MLLASVTFQEFISRKCEVRSEARKADIPIDVRGRFTVSHREVGDVRARGRGDRDAQMQNHLCEFYSVHLRRRRERQVCESRPLSSNMDLPDELVHRNRHDAPVARELERPEAPS